MTRDDKQARLAEALRANLRRRKAQARAVADTRGDSADDVSVAAADADQPLK